MNKACIRGLALLFFISSFAYSKQLGGAIGLGYSQNLKSNNGIALRYYPTDLFGIKLLVGGNFVKPDSGDSNLDGIVGLAFTYALVDADDLQAGIGIGGNFVSGGTDGLELEIPFEVQYFFTDYFSVDGRFGLNVAFKETEFTTSVAGNLLSGFGFSLWFQ